MPVITKPVYIAPHADDKVNAAAVKAAAAALASTAQGLTDGHDILSKNLTDMLADVEDDTPDTAMSAHDFVEGAVTELDAAFNTLADGAMGTGDGITTLAMASRTGGYLTLGEETLTLTGVPPYEGYTLALRLGTNDADDVKTIVIDNDAISFGGKTAGLKRCIFTGPAALTRTTLVFKACDERLWLVGTDAPPSDIGSIVFAPAAEE